MSRVDVDGEPGDVCVLMWLVVYSRPVVYATELESAFGYGNEKHRQRQRGKRQPAAAITCIRLARTGGWGSNVLPTIFTRAQAGDIHACVASSHVASTQPRSGTRVSWLPGTTVRSFTHAYRPSSTAFCIYAFLYNSALRPVNCFPFSLCPFVTS